MYRARLRHSLVFNLQESTIYLFSLAFLFSLFVLLIYAGTHFFLACEKIKRNKLETQLLKIPTRMDEIWSRFWSRIHLWCHICWNIQCRSHWNGAHLLKFLNNQIFSMGFGGIIRFFCFWLLQFWVCQKQLYCIVWTFKQTNVNAKTCKEMIGSRLLIQRLRFMLKTGNF